MIIHNPILTGSFTVNGVNVLGITGSTANLAALNTFTASAATTGSNNFVGNQVVSGSLTVTGSIITPGTLTAQTLVVQTITSSVDFVTGSTRFGSLSSNTHVFTGSMNLTGSLTVTTTGTELQVGATGVTLGNALTDSHNVTGSLNLTGSLTVTTAGTELQVTNTGVNLGNALTDSHVISGSVRINPNGLFVSSSGVVGIGTISPQTPLQILRDTTGNGTNIEEANMAFTVLSAAGQSKISIGASNAGNYGYIQVMQDATSWTSRNLTLQPRGGSVGIGTYTPARTLDVNGTFRVVTPNRSFFVTTNAYSISDGTLSSGIGMDGDGLYLGNVVSSTGWTIGNPQVTVRSSGNVGIGTINPSANLHIQSSASSGQNLRIQTSISAGRNYVQWANGSGDMGYIGYGGADGKFWINNQLADDMLFVNNGAERMRIFSNGDVRISFNPGGGNGLYFNDTTNGAAMLYIVPAVYVGSSPYNRNRFIASNSSQISFETGAIERVRIGNIGFTANLIDASDANSKIFLDQVNTGAGLIPTLSGTTFYLYGRSSSTNYRVTLSGSPYFTGQHGNKPINLDLKTNIQNYIGLIVSSTGAYYSVNPITQEVTTGKDAIQISEALPEIKLTDTDQDKAVWGVVTNVKNDNYNTEGTVETDNNTEWGDRLGSNVVRINGLGEGAIWVTNINGNIENGDYICSSTIPGYGRKQNDDLLHNYTVAKSTMDCDFDLNNDNLYVCKEFEFEGQTYKKAFIGCTYHCS